MISIQDRLLKKQKRNRKIPNDKIRCFEEEIERGRILAESLVAHVTEIGAGGCNIPVQIGNQNFLVSVIKIKE